MKNKIKYLINLVKVLVWPILFTLASSLISFIFVCIFNSKEQGTMSNSEFINYINKASYKVKLDSFISSKALIIALITFIVFFPLFYKLTKKYRNNGSFKVKNVFLPIILGVVISLIYNIIVFSLNNKFNFTTSYELSSIPIIVQIICSGIIGPILEELLFRGIVYNKLKKFNTDKISIILCSLIFGLVHMNLVDAIYAFILSFIFIYLNKKYKSLYASIIMHMSLNITIILMLKFIIHNYIIFNLYLLIVCLIILIFLIKYLKITHNNKNIE